MNKIKTHFNLGTVLQTQRLKLGYTIDQAHHATMINRKYLEMMETNNWSFTNSQTTITNYIRSYSKLLKLNEKLTIDLYKSSFYKPLSEDVKLVNEKKLNNNFSKTTLLASVLLLAFLFSKNFYSQKTTSDLLETSMSLSPTD